jgi:hypothetical protein
VNHTSSSAYSKRIRNPIFLCSDLTCYCSQFRFTSQCDRQQLRRKNKGEGRGGPYQRSARTSRAPGRGCPRPPKAVAPPAPPRRPPRRPSSLPTAPALRLVSRQQAGSRRPVVEQDAARHRPSKSRGAIRRRRGFTRPHGPNARARQLKSRRRGEGAMKIRGLLRARAHLEWVALSRGGRQRSTGVASF